jgi:predicted ATPase/DNA-binding SARP family transcriptional activator
LEAVAEGRALPLRGPKPRTVLARLLLDHGRTVSAGALVEDVWDGRAPATAGKTLQKYVSELRTALGDDVIRTRGRGYAVEAGEVDARRFERAVLDAQARQAIGDAAGTLRVADEAAALWRGEVLADLAEARFADGERARLGELRLVALELRYGAAVELGHVVAAAELEELVRAHPLREGLWMLLIRALSVAGRQAEALRAFERHRRFLADELGLEPSPALRELEQAVLRHELDRPSPAPARRGNLPHALSSFVGRRSDIVTLARMLEDHRLVTLVGPAGVGKTRLALELAPSQPGPTWFVDLAATTDDAAVPHAIAAALAVDDQPGQQSLDTVVTVLNHRGPALVVLDNCEQLVGPCADAAQSILRRCPSVRLLATSRVPLGVEGEYLHPVEPLDDADAVSLFVVRAGLAGAGFTLTPENRPQVEEICRRLDGLPLAIELAAGLSRVLDAGELAGRLDDRFTLLQSSRGRPARQRTLLAAVEWSYQLLTVEAREVFDRLGAFPGSFGLAAAEAVAGRDVLASLRELVDHSLVTPDLSTPGTSRYRLLDTLRLFARQRLDARDEWDRVQRAHAEYLVTLARAAKPHFYGPGESEWRTRLQAEDHNFTAVLDWAVEHDPVSGHQLAVELWRYWDVRWQERLATSYLRRLLDGNDPRVPAGLRAWALTVGADLGANAGEGRIAGTWAQEAVAVFGRLDDVCGLAHARAALASALGNRGALDEAGAAAQAALEAAEALGDEKLRARVLELLGFVWVRQGSLDRAASAHRQELDAWARAGSVRGRATALRRLAAIERDRRNLPAAEELCREAMTCMQQLDDAAGVAHVRLTLADLARLRGDDLQAGELYGRALEEVLAIGDRRCIASTSKNLGTMANARGDHGAAVAHFLDSMLLRLELGDDAGLAECLEGMAAAGAAMGRTSEAATVLAAAHARRVASGAVPLAQEAAEIEALTGSLRNAMEPSGFTKAWSEGLELDNSAMVALCRHAFETDR